MSLRIGRSCLFIPAIFVLGGLISGSKLLRADVIYTNFGAGDAYAAGSGLIVTKDGSAWSSLAVAFTPPANYYLTSIEFVATDIIPDDSGVSVGIFADNGGQPGGAPLESFTLGGPLGQFGETVPVLTVTSVLQPLLDANTQYWIGLQGPADGFVIWNQNTTLASGVAETDGSGSWSASDSAQGVVEVDGILAPDISVPVLSQTSPDSSPTENFAAPASTPEPGAWWLMAGGLFAIARRVRR